MLAVAKRDFYSRLATASLPLWLLSTTRNDGARHRWLEQP